MITKILAGCFVILSLFFMGAASVMIAERYDVLPKSCSITQEAVDSLDVTGRK